ncbi:MAG: TRAP transporter substrate-binding protein [Arenicella sp.]
MKKIIQKKYLLKLPSLLLLSLPLILLTTIAKSDSTTTLKMATWLPDKHVMNSVVLKEWGKWVNKATSGRVEISFERPKTHPKNMLELVKSGQYDIGWMYHGFWPHQFKLTQLSELPLNGVGPEAASVAHWRIHNKYFSKINEHQGMQLLALFTHGEAQLHLKKPIQTLSELQGMRVRLSGPSGTQASIANRLGLEGVIASPLKIYDLLKNNKIEGVFMPMVEKEALKLKEVAPYTYKFRGGLYLGSFGVFINPKALDGISPEDKIAILNVSGEKLSRFAGKAWHDEDIKGEKNALEYGNTIIEATPTMRDDFERLMLDMDNIWVNKTKPLGLDPDKILDLYRQLSRCGSITSRI